MRRRLIAILLTVAWALAGAAAGHAVAEMRRRKELGDTSLPEPGDLFPRPQEIVPGLIAAMRVRERPWSFLHIPPWFAAFAISFGFAVVSREFRSREEAASGTIEGVTVAPPPMPAPPAQPSVPHTNGDAHALEPEGFTAFAE
jgi:hypothetical protein